MIDPHRVLGGLMGIAVGGARGVARGDGPAGRVCAPKTAAIATNLPLSGPSPCWTADTGLAYNTVDALLGEYTLERLGNHLTRWLAGEHWASPPSIDYAPMTIIDAGRRIANEETPADAGSSPEGLLNTDNSSLVRVFPVAIAYSRRSIPIMLDAVHSAMRLTHAHPRCLMAAGLLSLIVRNLAYGRAHRAAYRYAMQDARKIYAAEPWRRERPFFRRVMRGTLGEVAQSAMCVDREVNSTLEAAVWALQTTRKFDDCLSRAVELGDQQTAVGALAGGLAGLAHGIEAIPPEFIDSLREKARLSDAARRFAAVVTV